MFQVTLVNQSRIVTMNYHGSVLLAQALSDAGLAPDLPCGGKGRCGNCRVRVEGALPAPTAVEQERLSASEIASGVRLACQSSVEGAVIVYCHYTTVSDGLQAVTKGKEMELLLQPLAKTGIGLAFDIGTTTIAAYCYELGTGSLLGTRCEKNRQSQFGADVTSRMEAAATQEKSALTGTIRSQLEDMASRLCEKPTAAVITGNTIMLHFLAGLDTSGIAVSPFRPESLFGEWLGPAYLPRCMSAYVGADITCAVLASEMMDQNCAMLVDIGTNGEMALHHNGKLCCCSTAAGPAFEGAGISCGMLAADGAVDKVWLEDGKLQYHVIGGVPARGLCGTGLIDAVACLLSSGLLDETGYLAENAPIGDSGVSLTAADIRAVQLAKAAILAGMETLLQECGVSCDEVETLYIAGGFGAYIDKDSAAAIGLIPEALSKKVCVLGNAAGMGASAILRSRSLLRRSEEIASGAEVIELSSSACFMERYIENMMFPQSKTAQP